MIMVYDYTQKLAPKRIGSVEPQQDDHEVQMVAAQAEEEDEGNMQRLPADEAGRQNQPEVEHVEQRPAYIRQACAAQTLLHKVDIIQCAAGQQTFIGASQAVAGDKEKGGDAVAA